LQRKVEMQLEQLFRRYPALICCKDDIINTFEIISACYRSGGKILVAGNGGSAADAEHIVGELMKAFCKPREISKDFTEKLIKVHKEFGKVIANNLQESLPAIALGGNSAIATAIMNDTDPFMLFAQQVNGYGRLGDVLLAISTSGNSKNILYSAIVARAKEMKVIGLTGSNDSILESLCDSCIKVPQTETYMIQEYHLPVYHTLCLMLEESFF